MNPAQRQEFAEKGYFVVRRVVSQAQLVELNQLYDAALAAPECEGGLGTDTPKAQRADGQPLAWHGFSKSFPRRLWGRAYYDLVDPPQLVPILRELLGNPQWEHAPPPPWPAGPERLRGRFRLDHDNIHFSPAWDPDLDASYPDGELMPKEYWSPQGLVRGGIHGGKVLGQDHISAADLSSGISMPATSRMITCVYELLPLKPGCGGTAFLPGTHRADHPRPPTATTVHHRPPWPEEFGMDIVQLDPGDCLVFSEKLLHATAPYTGRDQRRTLFYKYLPYGVARDDQPERRYYDLTVPGLTQQQRLIMGWPEERWDDEDAPAAKL
jgi:hypothetical protein